MNPSRVFQFCPRCSGKLFQKSSNLLECSKCGFKFYINPVPCNGVIIENEKKEILLVRRAVAPKKGFWDLPGGFIDTGENLPSSVKREIKEELGVKIKINETVGTYTDVYLYEGVLYPIFTIVVSANIVGGGITPADDVSGYKFFKKNNLPYNKIAFDSIKSALSDYLKDRR